MGHYVPHTDAEIAEMLAFCGLSSLDELFSAVPAAIRLASGELPLPDGLSEPDTMAAMETLAGRNRPVGPDLVCFAGGGAYDHDVPSVVRRVAYRAEYVTAYTPYQPEVAQGVLQALFEYQTLVARLSGLDVANASLYDGATACVEAINLAVAAKGRQTVVVSDGVNPHYRQVMDTFAAGTGHRLVGAPLAEGITAWVAPDGEAPSAVVVQYPNYLGHIEDLAEAASFARGHDALFIVVLDPVAAGLLRSPGEFGADVVVAEGQPFGTPLSFGGPYVGLFACRREHVRRLPGRLVGETADVDGRTAYVTTLRTREQDIRREKASSNVCTNQTLIAVCFAIQLAWLGSAGLRELALRCARGARYARNVLAEIEGIELVGSAPIFREFAIRTPLEATTVIERMAEEGYLAGVRLAPPPSDVGSAAGVGSRPLDRDGRGLLVAVTERRTRDEIDGYAAALEKVIR